jgi:hypothetical protein
MSRAQALRFLPVIGHPLHVNRHSMRITVTGKRNGRQISQIKEGSEPRYHQRTGRQSQNLNRRSGRRS